MFCLDLPFLPSTNWSADATKYAAKIPNITFSNLYVTEHQEEDYNVSFSYTNLDTIYNGRCLHLESDVDMTPGTYVKIKVAEEEVNGSPLWLYVYHPGTF